MELTKEQLETLKTMDWQYDRGEDSTGVLIYFTNTNDNYFQDITGVCVSCLRELLGNDNTMENFYWEIAYRFHKESALYDLHYAIWCKGDVVKDGIIQEFNSDVLSLFTKKEESDWREVLSYTLNQILQSESVEDVVDYIDNNFSSISDKIRENCMENLSKDDLDSDLVEEIGKGWVEENTSDAWNLIEENAYTSDLKEFVIRVIANNM